MSLALDAVLTRNEKILHAPVDADNAVMLDVVSGSYYGLNAVASRIWELLGDRPMSVGEICAQICEEFDVNAATCETAVLKFAETLVENGVAHAFTS